MMNICVLTRALPIHSVGGMEYNSFRLALNLSRLKAQVVIITTSHPDYPTQDQYINVEQLLIVYVGGCKSGIYSSEWQSKLVPIFDQLQATYYFDVVHSHNSAALGLYLSKRLQSVKYIITWHGMHFDWIRTSLSNFFYGGYDYKELFYIFEVFKRYIIEDFLFCHRADALIAIDKPAFSNLRYGFFKKKHQIHLIPTGLDTDVFYPNDKIINWTQFGFSESDKVLLSISRLITDKGIFVTLKAYKKILDRFKNVKLVIIGDGRDANKLKTLAKELSVFDSIRFEGSLPPEICAKYLRSSHVFLNPIIHDGGFNTTLLEAMACGCPIITTNLSCNQDIIEHLKTGILIRKGCSESLAEFTLQFFENEPFRQTIISNAIKAVHSKYEWSLVAQKTLFLFNKIIYKKN